MGHIEDIVVDKDQQGKKLGLRIIEALDYIAEQVGCYKVSSWISFDQRYCLPERHGYWCQHITEDCIYFLMFLTILDACIHVKRLDFLSLSVTSHCLRWIPLPHTSPHNPSSKIPPFVCLPTLFGNQSTPSHLPSLLNRSAASRKSHSLTLFQRPLRPLGSLIVLSSSYCKEFHS